MTPEIYASDLSGAWLAAQRGIKVLSLDCFDTLFWRRVVEPTDVFYPLAQSPAFHADSISAGMRQRCEASARRLKWIREDSNEVTLKDIYREVLPLADETRIQALMDVELRAEVEHGYIFKPVWDLIKAARSMGMKVVVVSDIYLSEDQLKELLFATMPEMAGHIDAFFTSSSRGQGKTAALWKPVLARLHVRPEQVCHLGDNRAADYEGAMRFGIRAHHLIQQRDEIRALLEQRTQVALQLFPHMRQSAAVPSAYHGHLAMQTWVDAADRMGYASLGPILYGFARYLQAEARALGNAAKGVKLAFLLRDGYLPRLALQALDPRAVTADLNISRFTAIAASLDSETKVQEMLARSLTPDNFEAMLKQLLISGAQAESILAKTLASSKPQREFIRLVTQKDVLRQVFERSMAFRRRLLRHIVSRTGVGRGDTLVFVDLGYSGTAQNMLAAILRDELGVTLIGRYLICAEGKAGVHDREGLLDPASFDPRIASAVTGQYIAAFEMMCTQAAPSTIDYTEDGEPLFSTAGLKAGQHAITERLQQACLRFIRDFSAVPATHRPREDMKALREGVIIDLARLLYFPSKWEIECIDSFEFDFNLGTTMKLSLVDTRASLSGMRQSGFMYMGADLKQVRTNYPMELRYLDISLTSLLFAQNRLGFSTIPARASFRREALTLVIANEKEHIVQPIEAVGTYDGYFSVNIPMSPRFHVALLLGARYEWIQIESVQRVATTALHDGKELCAGSDFLLDRIERKGDGLYAVSPEGMVLFAGQASGPNQQMVRFVFRPVVARAAEPVSARRAPRLRLIP